MRVGVLALQGDFSKHIDVLCALGEEVIEVRKPEDLSNCQGLIIPGGESTVMMRLMTFIGMKEPLLQFAKHHPIFGTCAGLILMSTNIQGLPFQPLELLDISIERNAFGTQVESFHSNVQLNLNIEQQQEPFSAFFIRAPRIQKWGDNVQILGQLENEPVLVRQGKHLGATFHPELTSDPKIHKYFIEMIRKTIL